jgi:hypothetical protein
MLSVAFFACFLIELVCLADLHLVDTISKIESSHFVYWIILWALNNGVLDWFPIDELDGDT